jgi:hypothetical protein
VYTRARIAAPQSTLPFVTTAPHHTPSTGIGRFYCFPGLAHEAAQEEEAALAVGGVASTREIGVASNTDSGAGSSAAAALQSVVATSVTAALQPVVVISATASLQPVVAISTTSALQPVVAPLFVTLLGNGFEAASAASNASSASAASNASAESAAGGGSRGPVKLTPLCPSDHHCLRGTFELFNIRWPGWQMANRTAGVRDVASSPPGTRRTALRIRAVRWRICAVGERAHGWCSQTAATLKILKKTHRHFPAFCESIRRDEPSQGKQASSH